MAGLLGGASLAALAAANPALAQDDTAIDEVVVTGSRVIANSTQSPTPLTVVSTEQLKTISSGTIPDALNKLPVFQGSSSPRNQTNSGSNGAGNVISLRNFGAQRTLVLLDGHRVAPSSAAGTANIDVLPQMLLERVDVVTGGASAVYGSDAVTGVVNFVLDKDFTGLKIDANTGISQAGLGFRNQIGVAVGTPFGGGRGHFEASARIFHADEVAMADLPYGPGGWSQGGTGTVANPFRMFRDGRTARSSAGGVITCFPANQPGCATLNGNLQFVGTGVVGPFVHGSSSGTAGLESGGDGAWGQRTTAQGELRSNEGFARLSWDFTDSITGYVNLIAASSMNLGTFYNTETRTNAETFFDTNAFLPASFAALLPGDRFNVAKDYTNHDRWDNWIVKSDTRYGQINAGLDGRTGMFDWDLYYTHGESHATVAAPRNNDLNKFFAAADAVINPANGQIVCQVSLTAFASRFPGCIPLNLFGPTATSQEMFDYLVTPTRFKLVNTLDSWGGSVAADVFELPAGPIRAAVSGEYRKAGYTVTSSALPTDFVDCSGLRLCTPTVPRWAQNVSAETDQSLNVWEVAAEAEIPLLRDMSFVESLSVNLAGRHTDYSVSGAVNTWKVGVDYHVNPSIRFRGTTSVDIRAPTMNDLFQPQTLASGGYFDLHTGVQAQTQTSTQGNPDLVPEKAKTYTAGIVLTPDFIPGFNIALDYYRITLRNAIGVLGGTNQQVAQLCEDSGGTADVCSLWQRPLPFNDRTPANYPTRIFNRPLNAAYQAIRGFDFEMNYRFDLEQLVGGAPGDVSLRILANHQPSQKTIQFDGAASTYGSQPKTRLTGSFSYRAGPWRVNVTDRWFDSYNKATLPTQVYTDPRVRSFNQVDLQVTREFKAMGADMNVYVDVENLFNADAPLYSTQASNPGFSYPVPTFYPIMGRYFTVGLRGTF
jgi:outer membrane receptor protein involved in Fe transport